MTDRVIAMMLATTPTNGRGARRAPTRDEPVGAAAVGPLLAAVRLQRRRLAGSSS